MSPSDRLTARAGALLIVDMQTKLLAAIRRAPLVLANGLRLVEGARVLGVPIRATEQYPKGLGPTTPELAGLIPARPAKLTFHCCGAPGLLDDLRALGVEHVTLAGIEAHVCVAQTALELIGLGFAVQVPADAVGSRADLDRDVALRRLERAGAIISTVEAVLFEWTETAEHPRFKAISALIRDFRPPGPGPLDEAGMTEAR